MTQHSCPECDWVPEEDVEYPEDCVIKHYNDEHRDDEIAIEPVFGHRFSIEVYEDDSTFANQMRNLRSQLGIEPRDRRRVKITEHDMEWDEPKTFDIRKEYFDGLIEKYQDELKDE